MDVLTPGNATPPWACANDGTGRDRKRSVVRGD
jgi:hypothetical protein